MILYSMNDDPMIDSEDDTLGTIAITAFCVYDQCRSGAAYS